MAAPGAAAALFEDDLGQRLELAGRHFRDHLLREDLTGATVVLLEHGLGQSLELPGGQLAHHFAGCFVQCLERLGGDDATAFTPLATTERVTMAWRSVSQLLTCEITNAGTTRMRRFYRCIRQPQPYLAAVRRPP